MKRVIESTATLQQAQRLLGSGRYADALRVFTTLTTQAPREPSAWEGRGLCAFHLRDFTEAATSFRAFAKLQPGNPAAQYSLAAALDALGDAEGAIRAYRTALQLSPAQPALHYNLGVILQRLRRLDEAETCYREALRMQPTLAEAHNNLGTILAARGDSDGAIDHYRQAIALRPAYVEARVSLGVARVRQGMLSDAEALFREVLRQVPQNVLARRYLASTLKHQGRLTEALTEYQAALTLAPNDPTLRSDFLLALNYPSGLPVERVYAEHRKWGELHGGSAAPPTVTPVHSGPDWPLRVGYVSADFYNHSVAHFIAPVLAHHDPARCRVYCYSDVVVEDATTARLRQLPVEWRATVGLSDAEVEALVRADAIDILVDLGGHTGNNRLALFARKPAPVQVSYLGYPNTTGLPAMDYRITDRRADPPGSEAVNTEALIFLDGCFLCYEGDDTVAIDTAPRASLRPPTFGSFNNLAKITPDVVAAWSRILSSVPESRLVLKNKSLRDEPTRQRFLALFATYGIRAERLELIGWLDDPRDHLTLYNRIDVALDTFPYNGTTTTCEALWMGVPVITLQGDRHAARVGASLLGSLGYDDWVAVDVDDYVRRAAVLVADTERLAWLRAELRPQMQRCPLCDGVAFARALETQYRAMWTRADEAAGGSSA